MVYKGSNDLISQWFLYGYCIFKDYKGILDIINNRKYLIHMKRDGELLPIEVCLMNNFIEGAILMIDKGADIRDIDLNKVFNGILINSKLNDNQKKECVYFLLDNGLILNEHMLYELIILKKSDTKLIESIIKRIDHLILNKLLALFNNNDIDKDIRLYYNQQIIRVTHNKEFQGSYDKFKETYNQMGD